MKVFTFLSLLLLMGCKSGKITPMPSGLELTSGEVLRLNDFKSAFVPSRNIDIWLPQNYSSNERYAVLYMHDGQMLFDAATTWNGQEWGVDETMSRLLEAGEIRKTIVVGIWNSGENRFLEYFPQKPFLEAAYDYEPENNGKNLFSETAFSDAYLKFIVEELKPYIDSNFSALPDRENTFIVGSSMGGLISWYAVTEYPEVFGGAAALSTHWPVFGENSEEVFEMFLGYLRDNLPAPGTHKFYFDYGTLTLDANYEPYQLRVNSVFEDYPTEDWTSLKFKGADHSENSWRERLEEPLKFLLKK